MVTSKNPKNDDGFDSELNLTVANYPLIPDGEYEAACFRVEGPKTVFGPKSWRIFLYFRIIGGEYHDVEIFFPLNFADKHGNKCKKIPVGSKLYHAISIAYGGRKPPGNLKNLGIFRGSLFRIRTKTITKNQDQTEKPTDLRYSVVDCLVERLTGS